MCFRIAEKIRVCAHLSHTSDFDGVLCAQALRVTEKMAALARRAELPFATWSPERITKILSAAEAADAADAPGRPW